MNKAIETFCMKPSNTKTIKRGKWCYVYYSRGSRLYYDGTLIAKYVNTEFGIADAFEQSLTDCGFSYPRYYAIQKAIKSIKFILTSNLFIKNA